MPPSDTSDRTYSRSAARAAEASLHMTIGKMEAEIRNMMRRQDEHLEAYKGDMKDVTESIKRIEQTLSEARGGWRILLLVGGAFAAVGALLSNVVKSLGV